MPQRYVRYSNGINDGRRKLSLIQKEEVKRLFADSKNKSFVARTFDVSVSTVNLILDPELNKRKNRSTSLYNKEHYDREKNRIAISKYRSKKRLLGLVTKPE